MIPTPRLIYESGAQRARYLGILSALLGALAILAFATTALKNPREVSSWADSLVPSYLLGRRGLFERSGEFLHCMKMMDESDTNWDNSLDMDEFRDFSNKMADHLYAHEFGTNLPKELKDVFADYAEKSEGKSNQIIDVYGSGDGEGNSVCVGQLRMLDELCRDTEGKIVAMFDDKYERLGHQAPPGMQPGESDGAAVTSDSSADEPSHNSSDAPPSKDAPPPPRGPQHLNINASFTMILSDNVTLADLLESLATGEDIGHLTDAFSHFVQGVVGNLGALPPHDEDLDSSDEDEFMNGTKSTGTEMRHLRHQQPRRRRRLDVAITDGSAEIYNYVESPCLDEVVEEGGFLDSLIDNIAQLAPLGNHTIEQACVTAMGKYEIVVDADEADAAGGLEAVYQTTQEATREAIDAGALEQELENEPDNQIFTVEGHGTVEDDNFDPYEKADEEPEKKDDGGLRTVDIILITVGSVLIFCLCCVLCFVELERKTRPRPGH